MGDEPRADISAKWVKWDGLKVWIRVPHNPHLFSVVKVEECKRK
jgi:hypothetical protein